MPELVFKGKEFVYNHHLAVPHRPLVPHAEKSVGAARLDGKVNRIFSAIWCGCPIGRRGSRTS